MPGVEPSDATWWRRPRMAEGELPGPIMEDCDIGEGAADIGGKPEVSAVGSRGGAGGDGGCHAGMIGRLFFCREWLAGGTKPKVSATRQQTGVGAPPPGGALAPPKNRSNEISWGYEEFAA